MKGTWQVDLAGYEHLLSLPGSGWSWEFKRRDPELRIAQRRARAVRPIIGSRADGSTIFRLNQRCHVAESIGLHFIPDPALSALAAPIFWLPDAMKASFDVVAQSVNSDSSRIRHLRWDELPGKKLVLISPGRRDKLVIRAPGYEAQLAIDSAGAPIGRAISYSLILGVDHLAAERLSQLEEFGRVCDGFAARLAPPRGARPQRLRDALIALDGELAGVSRRRIAEVIFGPEPICEGWDDGDESYKKRTKRLVEKGLELMRDGYRRLL
ncbi:MAG TPA: DUF2285 domain-containing protein [Parvularculaceae bacterium]|nr:DUF2285 domain-containing protein [Amphiplicatus sp.]HPE30251.1 DUF2285 domain-containing protein [Parvularculaceae bacterium]HRX40595.1 DUF2285 domain-containing protein [Parvularculaceae bacterium]